MTLIPKYRVVIKDDRTISSFQWLSLRWDAVRIKDGFTFVQYGQKPTRFLFKSKKGELPVFLLSSEYKTTYAAGRYRVGIARRPERFMRQLEALWHK